MHWCYLVRMNFIDYTNAWVKSEVTQGRIMIGIGVLALAVLFAIWRGEHALLKGALIPGGLLVLMLAGYGAYISQSRPAHGAKSIALFEQNEQEAITQEIAKHTADNVAGKTLMRWVYPGLILLAAALLLFTGDPYYRGMCLGFVVLFVSAFIMDSGFVMRSDAFIAFLEGKG